MEALKEIKAVVNKANQEATHKQASAELTMALIQTATQETCHKQRKADSLEKYKKRSILMQKIRRLELLVPSCHGRKMAKEAQLRRWGRQVAAMDVAARRKAQKNIDLGRFTAARGGKDDYAPLKPGRRDVAIPKLAREKTNPDGSTTKEICTAQADIEDIQTSNWAKLYGLGESGLTNNQLVDQPLLGIKNDATSRVSSDQAERLHPDILFKPEAIREAIGSMTE